MNDTKTIEAYSIFEEISSRLADNLESVLQETGAEIYSPEEHNPDTNALLAVVDSNPEYSSLLELDFEDKESQASKNDFYELCREEAPSKGSEPLSRERFNQALEEIRESKRITLIGDQEGFQEQLLSRKQITPGDAHFIQAVIFPRMARAAMAAYEERGYTIKRKTWLRRMIGVAEFETDNTIKKGYGGEGCQDTVMQDLDNQKKLDNMSEESGMGFHLARSAEGMGSLADLDYAWSAQGQLDEGQTEVEELGTGKKRPLKTASGVYYRRMHGQEVKVEVLESTSQYRGAPVYGRPQMGLDFSGGEKFDETDEFQKMKGLFGGSEEIRYKNVGEALKKIKRKYSAMEQTYQLDVKATLKEAGINPSSLGYDTIEQTLKKEAEDARKQDELHKRFAETRLAEED